jgi:hypothetical protein
MFLSLPYANGHYSGVFAPISTFHIDNLVCGSKYHEFIANQSYAGINAMKSKRGSSVVWLEVFETYSS